MIHWRQLMLFDSHSSAFLRNKNYRKYTMKIIDLTDRSRVRVGLAENMYLLLTHTNRCDSLSKWYLLKSICQLVEARSSYSSWNQEKQIVGLFFQSPILRILWVYSFYYWTAVHHQSVELCGRGPVCLGWDHKQDLRTQHRVHHLVSESFWVAQLTHFQQAWMHHVASLRLVQTCEWWAHLVLVLTEKNLKSNHFLLTGEIKERWSMLISFYAIILHNFEICYHFWNFMQCTLLCPLYIIRWFLIGLAIALVVPSTNPQHWSRGAPLAWITSEKSSGLSQINCKDSSKWLKRSCISSITCRI